MKENEREAGERLAFVHAAILAKSYRRKYRTSLYIGTCSIVLNVVLIAAVVARYVYV